MRVLLTGFEPFGGSDINSSWEAACRVRTQSFEDIELDVRQISVSFRRVGEEIHGLLETEKPDVFVMLGQRANSKTIDIERIAINMMDAAKPDNDGFHPDEIAICEGGRAAYFSNLPVKRLKDTVLANGIPSRVSNSAGLYVCNCAYYQALKVVEDNCLDTKVVFVHVPKIAEEIDVEMIADGVKEVIKCIKEIVL